MNNLLKSIIKAYKNKNFNNGLNLITIKANKLFKQSRNVVVCEYCGQPLQKLNASIVYDMVKNRIEYSHEKCFEQNNHYGNIEDLYNSINNKGDD